MFHEFFLFMLCFLAAPTFLVSRFVWVANLYKQIATYKAMLGAIFLLYGFLRLIDVWFRHMPFVYVISSLLAMVLGFCLGFDWIIKHVFNSNNPAKKRITQIYLKLNPYVSILALILVVVTVIQVFDY
jgi:hypothetical protein